MSCLKGINTLRKTCKESMIFFNIFYPFLSMIAEEY